MVSTPDQVIWNDLKSYDSRLGTIWQTGDADDLYFESSDPK